MYKMSGKYSPEIRDMQIAEIERTNDYAEEKYVLWLVCDMFSLYPDVKQGTVHVITDKGEIVVPQVTRKPYPNKCISHVSRCNGRRKLYGIPLCFDSLSELQEVKNIVIVWDQYFISHIRQERINAWTKNIEIYNTSFLSNEPDGKIFTLLSKTYPVYDSKFKSYLKEFQSSEIVKFSSSSELREKCSRFNIPGIEEMIMPDMNISTASLAYGVDWKEDSVEKTVVLLTADVTIKGQKSAGFGVPFSALVKEGQSRRASVSSRYA